MARERNLTPRKCYYRAVSQGSTIYDRYCQKPEITMSTVHYCVTRFKETGSGDSKPRSGRPRVTDKSHDSRMKRLVMNNPAMTSYEIKHFMQSPAKHYCVSCLMKF